MLCRGDGYSACRRHRNEEEQGHSGCASKIYQEKETARVRREAEVAAVNEGDGVDDLDKASSRGDLPHRRTRAPAVSMVILYPHQLCRHKERYPSSKQREDKSYYVRDQLTADSRRGQYELHRKVCSPDNTKEQEIVEASRRSSACR